jgi:hypothetical protein
MERTRLQAFKELRTLLSEVLASAVQDEEVPDAFKSKSNWDKLIAQTEQRLAEGWKQRFEAGMERRQKPRQLLDLLPPEEEQAQLLAEHFINEVSYQGRHSLDDLDRQLAAIAGGDVVDGAPNPLGPLAWVEGIRGGMKQIRCTPEERDWLLARLIPLLISRITGFYSTLSTQLAGAGYVVRGSGRGGGGVGARIPGAVSGDAFNPDLVAPLQPGEGLAGGAAVGGIGGAPTEGGEVLDRLFGLLSARRGGDGMGMPGAWPQGGMPGYGPAPPGFVPAMGGGAPGVPMQGIPGFPGTYPAQYAGGGHAGYPGTPGAPGFGAFPVGMPAPPGYVLPAGAPAMGGEGMVGEALPGGLPLGHAAASAPVAPWSQADIFSVLSMLQGSYAAAYGRGGSVVGHLHEAIGATANQIGLAGGVQAMPTQAQDMLELVSMLFEALLDGRRLDEKARQALAKLVIPYVRVAMLDRRMFMQSSHPARRVLNLLVEAFETAAPEVSNYRSLREQAFNGVERIIADFDEDLRVFEKLEELLASELEVCRRRAELSEKRAADAQSGKERRQAAREAVSRFLNDAIIGKSLPSVLLDFLAGPWQHHHTVVTLREGEEGEGVQLSRGLLEALLRSNDAGALEEPQTLRPVVVEVMASSGQPGSAADELLVELSLALAIRGAPELAQSSQDADFGPEAPADFDPPPPEPAAAARVLVESPAVILQHTPMPAETEVDDAFVVVSDAVIAELPEEIVERYRAYPIGTWLDFVAEDGRVTSARISWTSPISGRRILSNRRGQRMLVASPEELAEMEIEGRIRARHSESAFDQALHTIADRLEGSLALPEAKGAAA